LIINLCMDLKFCFLIQILEDDINTGYSIFEDFQVMYLLLTLLFFNLKTEITKGEYKSDTVKFILLITETGEESEWSASA